MGRRVIVAPLRYGAELDVAAAARAVAYDLRIAAEELEALEVSK